jgi:AcrR family transcriptional regulator
MLQLRIRIYILEYGVYMGRKSSFEIETVYAAVGAEVAEKGCFTLQKLSAATGMSTGSVYHRFESREALLAETWLHALQLFQTDFLAALSIESADAGAQAALATPQFCRANPAAAVILACCRQSEFTGPGTPAEMATRIAVANKGGEVAFRRFARRTERPLLNCRLAIIAYPLAAVRMYLPGRSVPKQIDAEILKAYHAAIETSE